jgi:hypothetical protein
VRNIGCGESDIGVECAVLDGEIASQVMELERRIQEKFDLQNAVVLRVSSRGGSGSSRGGRVSSRGGSGSNRGASMSSRGGRVSSGGVGETDSRKVLPAECCGAQGEFATICFLNLES